MAGSVLPLCSLCQGCKAQQTVTGCILCLIVGAEYVDECRIKEITATWISCEEIHYWIRYGTLNTYNEWIIPAIDHTLGYSA
ncbi:unnamed protein product [Dovyalis caffra]|uniref:Uncharacterized protein n=1 Tax=Dovyalis caffra TaxID=77055 RepID=A0AAV1RDB9_9ROSI|nr:unnamed protein product [Dovyalis caffra]